jgi:hypothetical protein
MDGKAKFGNNIRQASQFLFDGKKEQHLLWISYSFGKRNGGLNANGYLV